MEWKLIEVRQETDHPYLNYFTLVYQVKKDDIVKTYEYYMTSRRKKEELIPVVKKATRPDGVMIPLYYKDRTTGKISFLLTRQFRPALGLYVTSVPAGLVDHNDKDIIETAEREAKEEAGAVIDDIEVIAPIGSTSSGFSDETNGIVLARIDHFLTKDLEEFEDIRTRLYDIEEVKKMLSDENHFFALEVRTLLLYLIQRFAKKD